MFKLVVWTILVSVCCPVINGYFIYRKGVCPDGKIAGEDWYTTDCRKCHCTERSYVCDECSVEYVSERIGCYIVKVDYSSLNYPLCCKHYEHVCPGDKGFSEKKYEAYMAAGTRNI